MRVMNSIETFFIESRDSATSKGEGVHEKRSFQLGKIPPKGGTTNFSSLALADPHHWRDCAAPPAGRLAAGVGSGVASSRRDAGRMGSARLAQQARFAAPQYERVLGRAVVATKKIGGRNVSRLALWRTDADEESGPDACDHAPVGARHRRQYGRLHGAQWAD